jgi:hypothetical protein
MTASFPTSVKPFTAKTDGIDDVMAVDVNEIQEEIVAMQTILKDMIDAATELTIASDAITITQGNHKLQPQSGTADDLSTINGTTAGQFGVLYASDFGTDTITIKHNVGNILCMGGADISLSYGCVFWHSNGTKVFMSGGGGISTPVGVASGGTGQTTAYAAFDALTPQGANIASASTTDIGAATGVNVNVTGTTTITALGTKTLGVYRFVKFTGALILTHNATSLILPGGANITTANGDFAIFVSLGSGNWKCLLYFSSTNFWGQKAVPTGTVVGISDTQTLTNKRVNPRVSSEASSATPTINTDNVDAHSITALAVAITSMTTNLSGTPVNFQKLIIRIKDDGTARAIAWGASFEAKGVALPTTTVISKVLTVGFIYDTVTSKWGCVASAQEA